MARRPGEGCRQGDGDVAAVGSEDAEDCTGGKARRRGCYGRTIQDLWSTPAASQRQYYTLGCRLQPACRPWRWFPCVLSCIYYSANVTTGLSPANAFSRPWKQSKSNWLREAYRKAAVGTRFCFTMRFFGFWFESVIFIPRHAAQKAMAAAPPKHTTALLANFDPGGWRPRNI